MRNPCQPGKLQITFIYTEKIDKGKWKDSRPRLRCTWQTHSNWHDKWIDQYSRLSTLGSSKRNLNKLFSEVTALEKKTLTGYTNSHSLCEYRYTCSSPPTGTRLLTNSSAESHLEMARVSEWILFCPSSLRAQKFQVDDGLIWSEHMNTVSVPIHSGPHINLKLKIVSSFLRCALATRSTGAILFSEWWVARKTEFRIAGSLDQVKIGLFMYEFRLNNKSLHENHICHFKLNIRRTELACLSPTQTR